jgi:hypothetical protein
MKILVLIVSLCVMNLSISVMAVDNFPDFSETQIQLIIPTNMPGYDPFPGLEAGTNAVYPIIGEVFPSATAGHIQTIAEGFSGTTDKKTPWKTLTELLAAYQHSCNEQMIRPLYSASSKEYVDGIFLKPEILTQYKEYGKSIIGMRAVLGFKTSIITNGYVALVSIDDTDPKTEIIPIYFVKTNGIYYLSSITEDEDPKVGNLVAFLRQHSAKDLLK